MRPHSSCARTRATRRYRLGVALHGLALAAPSPLEQLAELRPLLEGLAQRTGETAYLMLRQGDEVLCIARAEGPRRFAPC